MKKSNNDQRIFKDYLLNGRVLIIFFISLLFIAGLFLFFLYLMIKFGSFGNNSSVQFDSGNINIELLFLGTGSGLILLGIIFSLLLDKLVMKRSFELFENRIVSKYKNFEETDLNFVDITEVYRYRTLAKNAMLPIGVLDCLAYRKHSMDRWKTIRPILTENKRKFMGTELIKSIINKQIEANLPIVLEKINLGEDISFQSFSEKGTLKRDELERTMYAISMMPLKENKTIESAKTFKNVQFDIIMLRKESLTFRNNIIHFKPGDKLIKNKYNIGLVFGNKLQNFEIAEEIFILDSNNNVKCSFDTVNLINGDLFIKLVELLLLEINKVLINESTSADIIEQNIEQSEI